MLVDFLARSSHALLGFLHLAVDAEPCGAADIDGGCSYDETDNIHDNALGG